MRPDMKLAVAVDCRGFIVTSKGGSGGLSAQENAPDVDFTSRYFAPRAGVDEDPVTGSSHACLGPYWSRKLDR